MSFDTLAPHYRWMEFILAGDKLQRCRTAFLDAIPNAQTILLLGEGPGRCLMECCGRFNQARITCVDASERMHAQARRQLTRQNADASQVEFIRSDVLDWSPPAQAYDLVMANFFLDCFRADQLEKLVPALAASTRQDGNWLIADFQVPAAGWKRIRSRLMLWAMYRFFRVVTRLPARKLTPPDSYLEHAGFSLYRRAETEWGLLRSDWWGRRKETTNVSNSTGPSRNDAVRNHE